MSDLSPACLRLIDTMAHHLVEDYLAELRTGAANSDAQELHPVNEAA